MIKKRDICVVCAEDFNEIGEHVLQLVTKARTLHNEGGGVVTVLCAGCDTEKALDPLFIYGGQKVIASKKVPQNRYEYADAIVQMLSMCDPKLILFPSSDWGETSAAHAAIRLQAGLTANCMDISIDNGDYVFTRAAMNGTVFAKIVAHHTDVAICTIQRNAFSKMKFQERDKCLSAQIIELEYKMPFPAFDVLESQPMPALNRVENLDYAKLVFGFGRGLGGGEALQVLHKVAAEYKAEIVGTRAVHENGLIEKSRQVGQSGISIAPSIYIAFGISGASQHMVGVMNARRIISVNTDPNAPIITFSNEVIIEDCKTILNKLSALSIQNQ